VDSSYNRAERKADRAMKKLLAQKRLTDRAGVIRAGPVDISCVMPTSSTSSPTIETHAAARFDLSSRSIFSIEIRNAASLVTRRKIKLCA
jgi:hypothetical protein